MMSQEKKRGERAKERWAGRGRERVVGETKQRKQGRGTKQFAWNLVAIDGQNDGTVFLLLGLEVV